MNDSPHESQDPAVRIHDLTKRFGFKEALCEVSFTLNRGEFLAVFGPNGAGKSTLIRILATLMGPTSGAGTLLGFDLEGEGEAVRGHIGVLTHHPLLFDNLTARENLKFYGQMFGVKDLTNRVEKLLIEVGLIDHRDGLVGTFSRGMQQRLAIARALIHDPDLLLLDEPYTGLDQKGIAFLKETLRAFLDGRRTAVMTSHDFGRGLELSTKAAILNHGHLVYYGDPSTVEGGFEFLYQERVG